MLKFLKNLFHSSAKEEKELGFRIDEVWFKVENGEYLILEDYLNELEQLSLDYSEINFSNTKMALLYLKRIHLLYQMLSLTNPPNGLKVASFFLKNKGKKKRIGYMFHKEALKQYRLKVKWSNRLLDESHTVKTFKDFIVVESLEPLNNLAYLANIIYDLETNDMLLERNPEDTTSKLAYLEIKEGK